MTDHPKALAISIWLLLWATPSAAWSDEVSLRVQTIGQAYTSYTLGGDVLGRRRLAHWAELYGANLLGTERLSLEASFRISAELTRNESPSPTSAFDEEDEPAEQGMGDVELLVLAFHWSRPEGVVEVTAGRQMILDGFDFLWMDGVDLSFQLTEHFLWKFVAGFRVAGKEWLGGEETLPLGADAGETAPVLGSGLLYHAEWLDLGLNYRRVVLWGEEWPLDEERLGAFASTRFLEDKIGLDGLVSYDLLEDRWDRQSLSGWGMVALGGQRLKLDAGYLKSRPRFSLDSIFQYFSPAPFEETSLGLRWEGPLSGHSVRAAYAQRVYLADEEALPAADGTPDRSARGIDLDGRIALTSRRWLSLTASSELGASGTRFLFIPRLEWLLAGEAWLIDLRGWASSFADPVQKYQHAWSLGASSAVTYHFRGDSALITMVDFNSNRLGRSQFRVFAVLDFAFAFGQGIPP